MLSVASGVLWSSMPTSIWLLPIVVLFLVLYLTNSAQWAMGAIIGCAVVILHANLLKDRTSLLFQHGEQITLQGKVVNLYQPTDHGGRFTFLVDQIDESKVPFGLRPTIQVFESSFSDQIYTPQLGEYWQLHVSIKPIIGRLNDAGFDSEQYYVANSWSGKAVIESSHPDNHKISPSSSWRLWLHGKVASQSHDLPAFAYLLALGFGDRSYIESEQWQQLKDTGLSHLMAISGLHIGLAMLIGWWVGVAGRIVLSRCSLFQFSLFHYRSYCHLPLIFSGLLALFYAYLAGFSLPTERAVIMGGAFLFMKVMRLYWAGWQVLLYTLCLILALDPFSILQVSFWLSFYAIFIIYLSLWFITPSSHSWIQKIRTILIVQIGIFIGLSPLSIIIFGGISLISPIVNILVIPWVSFVTVPLLFMSLFVTAITGLLNDVDCSFIWQWVDVSLRPVLWVLEWGSGAWMNMPIWCGYGVFLFSLSLVLLRFRWHFAVMALWLGFSCVLVFPIKPEPKWRIDMLDVGQGLALLIGQHGRWVLYDTGVNWPGGSMAQSVIIPTLQQKGIHQLDGLVISHTDSDHAGGRTVIQEQLSPKWKRSSEKIPGYQPCVQGESWRWGELQFEALWPPKRVDRAYNPHSCVIQVSDGHFSLLLTGDIDAISEILIARQYPDLQAQVMSVPHHGSRTSSLFSFIEAVEPELALASVAKNNQWNLPAKDVVERYQQQGIRWLDTGNAGKISIFVYEKQWLIETKRASQYEPWYRQIVRKGLE